MIHQLLVVPAVGGLVEHSRSQVGRAVGQPLAALTTIFLGQAAARCVYRHVGQKHLVMKADENMNKHNDDHGHDSNTRTRSSLQGSHNVSYNNMQA